MVKTVLLDLDDTILDFKESERCAIRQALSFAGIDPTDDVCRLYSEINDSLWKKLEKGEITRKKLLTYRFEILFDELSVDFDVNEMQDCYMQSLSQQVHFVDGAKDLLETLCKKYELAIVSNGTARVQNPRLDRSGIRKYFKHIFISEEIGFNKPSAEFFNKVFEVVDRQSSVIIGDSESSDILGGKNAGIRSVRYSPLPCKTAATAVAHKLCDIPNILENF